MGTFSPMCNTIIKLSISKHIPDILLVFDISLCCFGFVNTLWQETRFKRFPTTLMLTHILNFSHRKVDEKRKSSIPYFLFCDLLCASKCFYISYFLLIVSFSFLLKIYTQKSFCSFNPVIVFISFGIKYSFCLYLSIYFNIYNFMNSKMLANISLNYLTSNISLPWINLIRLPKFFF